MCLVPTPILTSSPVGAPGTESRTCLLQSFEARKTSQWFPPHFPPAFCSSQNSRTPASPTAPTDLLQIHLPNPRKRDLLCIPSLSNSRRRGGGRGGGEKEERVAEEGERKRRRRERGRQKEAWQNLPSGEEKGGGPPEHRTEVPNALWLPCGSSLRLLQAQLWLSMITGETIWRISEGFVLKGDRQHNACDNKMLGLSAKKLGSRDKEGSPGQAGGTKKTHSIPGK